MTKSLDAKLPAALITGAGRRIGRQIALDLAAQGYRVAVHYNHSIQDAEQVVAEIINSGGQIEGNLPSDPTTCAGN